MEVTSPSRFLFETLMTHESIELKAFKILKEGLLSD